MVFGLRSGVCLVLGFFYWSSIGGLLGISFHHVLFDIFGLTALLRELMAALQERIPLM